MVPTVLAIAALFTLTGGVIAQTMTVELRREQHGAWLTICYRDRIDDSVWCNLITRLKGSRSDMPRIIIATTLPRENPSLRIWPPDNSLPVGGMVRSSKGPAERLIDCNRSSCSVANEDATIEDLIAGGPFLVRIDTRMSGQFEGEADLTGFKAGLDAWRKAVKELKN